MIKTVDLHKSFDTKDGKLHVLKGVTEHIAKGEVVSIIGPSGGGKSTFLRCLNLLETPDSGQIFFEGTEITDKNIDINVHRQKMGMVFQHFNVFPHLTVKNNITLAPVMTGKKSQAEADEDLAFINRVNAVNMMTDEDFQGVRNLASKTFTDENGQTQSLLTDREITMLSVRKGTLTAEERVIMQGHVASTSHILKEVRFPQMFADVPVWASCHHELLNSKGYPKGLSGSEIPKEVRLLTILDIFEAFTAKDRPYKPAHSVENAWEILDGMVREGAVDGEILEDFKKSRAWACVAAEE